jgi:hypothetical protein
VLTHELIHAAVGLECGHKGAFLKAMRALGLEGKATATVAGARWSELFGEAVAALADYPHARLDGAQSSGPKKQTTRLLKVECGCGVLYRMSRKVAELGLPRCGACGGAMACDALEGGEGDDGEAASEDAADAFDLAANAAPASRMAELVAAVRDHALANYDREGWDVLVECWDDDQIAEVIGNARTVAGAIKAVRADVRVYAGYRDEIIATEW